MWLGGTKLKSLCEPSLSLCSRRGSRLLWLPSALSILSKEPLQPGPALISCRQTAACSGSAAPTELVTAARCTGTVCAEPAVSALCPLAATQVLPQGKPVTHRSCPAQQLNTEDTEKGCEPAESLWAKDFSLTYCWAIAEGNRGKAVSFVKPSEMWGWQAWHTVELPHIWLDLPHAEEPAKAKQGQTGASEHGSRKPPGYEG